MSIGTVGGWLPRPTRTAALVAVGVLSLEALVLVGYFALSSTQFSSLRYVLYPFVWINIGLAAVALVPLPTVTGRRHRIALGASVAYFLVLAFASGLLAINLAPGAHSHAHIHGWQVAMTAPGWGPRIGYATDAFHVYFVPYRVVGYLALAYLAYVAVAEAVAGAASGLVGLASCVGCSFPVVAPLLGGAAGGSSALATTVLGYSIDLSTAAFVLAVVLLSWRPLIDEWNARRRPASARP